MHPSYKLDSKLGKRVHEHLVNEGLETPMLPDGIPNEEKTIR